MHDTLPIYRFQEVNVMYTSYESLPLTLSIEQVAEVLGIGKNTAYALVRAKKIRSVKVGRQFRIPKDALYHYLHEESA